MSTLPDVEYSRKAATIMNSAHVLALPAEQQWALRDALAEHDSEESLPPHLKRLFSDSIHPALVESAFDPRLHPRDRAGKFSRVLAHLRKMPKNSADMLGSVEVIHAENGMWMVSRPGSVPPTAHETIEQAAEHVVAAAAGESMKLEQTDFSRVFDGFEHAGLRARVTATGDLDSARTVNGVIDNVETGETVGRFTRETDDSYGVNGVYHDMLKLEPDYQGRGFGTAFFEHSVQEYKKLGYTRIRVQAADRVGGYQWARRGFDFDLPRYSILSASLFHNAPRERRDQLFNDERFARAFAVHEMYLTRFMGTSFAAWKSYGGVSDEAWQKFTAGFPTREQMAAYVEGDESALDGIFTSPQEIATFDREHRWIESHDSASIGVEMWLGKRFLAGAKWRGEMQLGGE